MCFRDPSFLPPSTNLFTDMETSMRPCAGVNFTAFDNRFPKTRPSFTGSISTKISSQSGGGNIVMSICLDNAGKNWSFAFVFKNSTSGVRLFVNIIIPASIFSKVSKSFTICIRNRKVGSIQFVEQTRRIINVQYVPFYHVSWIQSSQYIW